jgi:hypothetical protein
MVVGTGEPAGAVLAGDAKELGARALGGPYLRPGTLVKFVVVLADDVSGQRITITTPETTIDASS